MKTKIFYITLSIYSFFTLILIIVFYEAIKILLRQLRINIKDFNYIDVIDQTYINTTIIESYNIKFITVSIILFIISILSQWIIYKYCFYKINSTIKNSLLSFFIYFIFLSFSIAIYGVYFLNNIQLDVVKSKINIQLLQKIENNHQILVLNSKRIEKITNMINEQSSVLNNSIKKRNLKFHSDILKISKALQDSNSKSNKNSKEFKKHINTIYDTLQRNKDLIKEVTPTARGRTIRIRD
jgi:hypothetical protein